MVKQFQKEVARLKKQNKPDYNSDRIQVTTKVEVNPEFLLKHSNLLNWKEHPKRQLDYLADMIKNEVGWAGSALFCANTDRMLDGHGRAIMACKEQLSSMPVEIGWYTKEQGDEILASLDTSNQMSSVDGNALKSLTESIIEKKKKKKGKKPSLSMFADVHGYAKRVSEERKDKIGIHKSRRSLSRIISGKNEAKTDNRESGTDYQELYDKEVRHDLIFPSTTNTFGIPDLVESKLYTDVDLLPNFTYDKSGKSLLSDSFYCQGSRPFDSSNHLKPIGGFLGMYCEDGTMQKYYREPVKWMCSLQDERWHAVFEPDYSTYWEWPFAQRLWSVFRSRWCCRFWQEHGIRTIPILRRTNNFDKDVWMFYSLPDNTPIAAMQLRMGGKKNTSNPDYWSNIGQVLEFMFQEKGLKHVLFHCKPDYLKYVMGKIPDGLKYSFVTPYMDKRRELLEGRKKNK